MPQRRKIRFGEQELDAEPVELTGSEERWNEYLLADGSSLRLKPVAIEVLRIVGAYDTQGNPVYVVKSQNVLSVVSPESLRKAASAGGES